jgi:hypothetical protein
METLGLTVGTARTANLNTSPPFMNRFAYAPSCDASSSLPSACNRHIPKPFPFHFGVPFLSAAATASRFSPCRAHLIRAHGIVGKHAGRQQLCSPVMVWQVSDLDGVRGCMEGRVKVAHAAAVAGHLVPPQRARLAFMRRLHHDRAAAVAEQDAGACAGEDSGRQACGQAAPHHWAAAMPVLSLCHERCRRALRLQAPTVLPAPCMLPGRTSYRNNQPTEHLTPLTSVPPVHIAGERIGADHQHVAVAAAAHEVGRRDEAHHEAGARRREVEGDRPAGADEALHLRHHTQKAC